MKALALVTAYLVYAIGSYAQTTYYRYDQSTGTSQEIGYSTPTAPSTYTTPYTPRIDINLYKDVLAQKQEAYDRNYKSISDQIDDIVEIIRRISSSEAREYYIGIINKVIADVNSGNYDLSNSTTYYSFIGYLKKLKNGIYDYLDTNR